MRAHPLGRGDQETYPGSRNPSTHRPSLSRENGLPLYSLWGMFSGIMSQQALDTLNFFLGLGRETPLAASIATRHHSQLASTVTVSGAGYSITHPNLWVATTLYVFSTLLGTGDIELHPDLIALGIRNLPTRDWVWNLGSEATHLDVLATALGIPVSEIEEGALHILVRLSPAVGSPLVYATCSGLTGAIVALLAGLHRQNVIVIKRTPWARATVVPEPGKPLSLSDEEKQAIISRYMATQEGREKLASAMTQGVREVRERMTSGRLMS